MQKVVSALSLILLSACVPASLKAQPNAGQRSAGVSRVSLCVEVLSGDSAIEGSRYMKTLTARLVQNWSTPAFLQELEDESILDLTVAPDGKLTSVELQTPAHDEALNRAAWIVVKGTPYAALPSGATEELKLRVHVSLAAH